MIGINKIYCGDCQDVMQDIDNDTIDCIVTSPPYWGLRDYGVEGQIGLEPTLEEYHLKLLEVTAECKRVLKKTGTMFWVHGDSYDTKILAMQNYRLAMRMVDEQEWILRNILIWHKNNHMPSSVHDRFTNAYEPVFFFSKSKKYLFDLDAIRVPHTSDALERTQNTKHKFGKSPDSFGNGEKAHNAMGANIAGKNPGDVFTLLTQPFPEAHFAVFPETLIEPFIKAGCPKDGLVLDPFMGAGTTAVVAKKLSRNFIGIELNSEYIKIARKRIAAIPSRLDSYNVL